MIDVEGTPFDFRTPKTIGQDIEADDINLRNGSGYDHNFILRGEGMRDVCVLSSSKTGIVCTTATTQPGIQIYTANFMTDRKGKGGTSYGLRDAVCLETQHFPDSPNHPQFIGTTVLRPGEKYDTTTIYAFSVR